MKQLLTTAILGLATVGAVIAGAGSQKALQVPNVSGDGTTIYGEVTFSNSMNVTSSEGLAWGLYSFNAGSPMTVSPLTIHNTLCANGGGTYRKGKVYFTSYYQDMTGSLGYLYFIELNLEDYSIERHALVPSTYDAIAADMTYDPVGDKIYGVSFDPEDYDLASYILVDYDLSTGYPSKIGSIDRMSAIACDNMGQMWGVRYTDGKLVKIDKGTGTITDVIGSTGVSPIYNGSACFDFQTGKLYWSTNERNTEEAGLYQIDIITGQASLISMFPDNESIAAMYIPRADDITTLNSVTNLSATFDGSSLDGTISFTAPATAKDGTPLDGNVTVQGYLDGVLNFTDEVAPGAICEKQYTLTQGMHNVQVVATHRLGRADRVSLDFYVGSDGPAAVGNLTATKTGDNKVKLTWDTPTGGEHGGSINQALLYYKITRLPDGKVLTDEATGNEYTDNISATEMRRYSYQVTGYYKNIEGATALSNDVEIGAPQTLPYLQAFDTESQFNTMVLIDNNYDTSRPGEGYWRWEEQRECADYKYHTFLNGDDWMITPGFELSSAMNYKLTFKAQGGRYNPETMEVKIGKGYSADEMAQTIMPRTDIQSPTLTMNEYEFTFNVPEDGHYYIGFHALTVKGMYDLYVDDIKLEAGSSMSSPGAVTNLTATPGQLPNEINVSLTAPATDQNGQTLQSLESISVYRDDNLVKSFSSADGLTPGKVLEFTDTDVTVGAHTYRAVAANSNGEGAETTAEVYAGLDTPLPVTAVTHTSADGRTATVSWTAPTSGVNGGSLAYEPLTYTVTDQDGNVWENATSETSFSEEIDTTDGQKSLIFSVTASNSAGRSEAVESGFITYGEAFANAFAESFAGGQKPTNSGWFSRILVESPYDNGFYGRYFAFSHNPNDWDRGPIPTAQDNDGGMLVAYTDFLDVEARMISPKINVAGLANPVLTFWFYHYFNPDLENGYSTEKETMDVEVYVDGEFKSLLAHPLYLINGNGWYRYDLPLKAAVGAKDFQIAFRTHNYISYDMHVDNITVHDTPDHDLRVESFTMPSQIAVNSTRQASVTVFNNGMLPASGYTVELLRDGETYATIEADEQLEFGKEKTFNFDVTPQAADAGKTMRFQARVVYDVDSDTDNNNSQQIEVTVPTSNLNVPTDLTAEVTGSGNVVLSWSMPELPTCSEITDGFESYEPFTITDFGRWSLYDGDGSLTYTISGGGGALGDYEYPNAGYQMAFQCFNPSKAGITSKLWEPYLGEQMAVCFAAAERYNDDWLISPEVVGGTTVSFMAKSVVDTYGLDKFYFCYSTATGDDLTISSFVRMGDVNVVPASEWTYYEFVLPEDATYFAINCVSEVTYAFLVDDVTFTSLRGDVLSLAGYNVYLDGERINSEPVTTESYTDTNPKREGAHIYNVTALWDKGESGMSSDCLVDLTGVSTLEADGMSVRGAEGAIVITNGGGRFVTITSVNGITRFAEYAGDYARISVEQGVYLVKAGDRVIKVLVK